MKPVRQDDKFGCAVACIAFILKITYREALILFRDGKRRTKEEVSFYCPELVQILNNAGLNYTWAKLHEKNFSVINANLSIVFIKSSYKYPYGHFLCKYNNKWMDSWVNLPNRRIEAGFREKLPGEPTYALYKGKNAAPLDGGS